MIFSKIFLIIYRVHKRFREVSPDLVPKSMTGNEPITIRVPLEKMTQLPEFRVCTINLVLFFFYFHLINFNVLI